MILRDEWTQLGSSQIFQVSHASVTRAGVIWRTDWVDCTDGFFSHMSNPSAGGWNSFVWLAGRHQSTVVSRQSDFLHDSWLFTKQVYLDSKMEAALFLQHSFGYTGPAQNECRRRITRRHGSLKDHLWRPAVTLGVEQHSRVWGVRRKAMWTSQPE